MTETGRKYGDERTTYGAKWPKRCRNFMSQVELNQERRKYPATTTSENKPLDDKYLSSLEAYERRQKPISEECDLQYIGAKSAGQSRGRDCQYQAVGWEADIHHSRLDRYRRTGRGKSRNCEERIVRAAWRV